MDQESGISRHLVQLIETEQTIFAAHPGKKALHRVRSCPCMSPLRPTELHQEGIELILLINSPGGVAVTWCNRSRLPRPGSCNRARAF